MRNDSFYLGRIVITGSKIFQGHNPILASWNIPQSSVYAVCIGFLALLINQTKNTRWVIVIIWLTFDMIYKCTQLIILFACWIAEGIFLIRRSKGGS